MLPNIIWMLNSFIDTLKSTIKINKFISMFFHVFFRLEDNQISVPSARDNPNSSMIFFDN